ncbi:TetR/AcrR family transcriptional regulator [Ponticoccus sp. SC2-23]|uniref:TetR/AcrR family transcriptional regulator n=1 Tax=Alexandriicola marinus TaxID=2081710 RepID=UPI000FDCAF51|nr:TetR/AcrR family transcriptional regulator [Alexandriicola marinus]MBM1221872.1 TetR/AcrR family transcriptional regulator [Ponticoccus sp. SC6-9]MBM1226223.1 TetR/AcrR family transcriptional regulator [Ponticoccus sp. SC6-15]MBM1230819.1 TetR/AcrR family transcriptional regulator [Ponticoccus sp. SC6-38]MBM1235340.1 TetR/AcrR family transcriptional regulator [Ponticoccus sp. SC6-45]MBM1239841.1 TetR/AcrR family transcriptional regulator [Ponticoccus sp. SC6-49]MBM1243985.1 TetR/AcrR famil
MPDGANSAIKRGRKFDQVLAGAREVFMTDGFDGASVDDIAKRSGVSKATLYSYFPDKQRLFMEVAKSECLRQADEAIASIDMSAPVEEILGSAGRQIVRFITSDFGQSIFRICVAESERFPALGRDFYESGPALVRSRLTEFFATAAENGALKIDDLELAADQFHMLCKVDILDRVVFKNEQGITHAAVDRVVDGAVATFMARYRA